MVWVLYLPKWLLCLIPVSPVIKVGNKNLKFSLSIGCWIRTMAQILRKLLQQEHLAWKSLEWSSTNANPPGNWTWYSRGYQNIFFWQKNIKSEFVMIMMHSTSPFYLWSFSFFFAFGNGHIEHAIWYHFLCLYLVKYGQILYYLLSLHMYCRYENQNLFAGPDDKSDIL